MARDGDWFAARCVENVADKSYWASAQNGFAILFTVRNEYGGAPWNVVQNITFTNNIVRHSASGINVLGTDYLYPSQLSNHMTIKNNLLYDISTSWGGSGTFSA